MTTMTTRLAVENSHPVSCTICHREVPRAESLSAEGQDYLWFFCGLGCYEQWHQSAGAVAADTHGDGE
jgi:hypothetical protein